jgi:hypothetical protein
VAISCALAGLCALPAAAAASGWTPPVAVSSGYSGPFAAAIASGGDATVVYEGTQGMQLTMTTRDLVGGAWEPERVVPFSRADDPLAFAVADGGAGAQLALGYGPEVAARGGIGAAWTALSPPFPTAFVPGAAPAVSPAGDLAVVEGDPYGLPGGVYVALRPAGASTWRAPLLVDPDPDGFGVVDVGAAADGHGALDVAWELQAGSSPVVSTMRVAQVSIVDGVASAPQTLASFSNAKFPNAPSDLSLESAGGRSLIDWVAGKRVDAAERQAGSSTYTYLGVVSGKDRLYGHARSRPVASASMSDDGGVLLAWVSAAKQAFALRAVQSTVQAGRFPAAVSVTPTASTAPFAVRGAKLPGSGAMLVWSPAQGSIDASQATGPSTWSPPVVVTSSAGGPQALAAAPTGEAITIWGQSYNTWASTFTP